MNELWHTLASAGAFVSASLVGVLYQLEQRRLARLEETHEKLKDGIDKKLDKLGDDIRELCERVAALEERTVRWNGAERRG